MNFWNVLSFFRNSGCQQKWLSVHRCVNVYVLTLQFDTKVFYLISAFLLVVLPVSDCLLCRMKEVFSHAKFSACPCLVGVIQLVCWSDTEVLSFDSFLWIVFQYFSCYV